jgi:hypothetical protein
MRTEQDERMRGIRPGQSISRIVDYLYHCTTYNCIFTCDIIKYLSKLSIFMQLMSLIAIPGPAHPLVS